MTRHGHDRPGAVAHQDVVGDPDRDRLAVDRVDRVPPVKTPVLVLARSVRSRSLLRRGLRAIVGDAGVCSARREPIDQRVLGGEHHVGRAEESIGAGREDPDDVVVGDSERPDGDMSASAGLR